MQSELKPCPFCGSVATTEPWHGGAPTKQMISCSSYDCDVSPCVSGETPDEARSRWNRRAALSDQERAVEVKAMPDQRALFEAAVVGRLKESGFLEIEIRTECLARCDDGYQDEVINAGWHYWNAALSANPSTSSKLIGHVTENDPNAIWGKKTISMTFMELGYSATVTATVGGNCRALDNLSSALSQVYDGLAEDRCGVPYLILTDANGDTLHVGDEDGRDNDWLMGMLVDARLINSEPEVGR